MFGYRRIYKCGLVVFLLSSLFCALSDSLQMLTLARIAQGFGGAALMSVNTALIRLIYPSVIWDEAWELTLYRRRLFRRGSDDRRGDFVHLVMEMAVSD